jgi:hypothetical protein
MEGTGTNTPQRSYIHAPKWVRRLWIGMSTASIVQILAMSIPAMASTPHLH